MREQLYQAVCHKIRREVKDAGAALKLCAPDKGASCAVEKAAREGLRRRQCTENREYRPQALRPLPFTTAPMQIAAHDY